MSVLCMEWMAVRMTAGGSARAGRPERRRGCAGSRSGTSWRWSDGLVAVESVAGDDGVQGVGDGDAGGGLLVGAPGVGLG